ncbi:MAG: ribosome biogenesis GTPase Der [Bauldia sp.]
MPPGAFRIAIVGRPNVGKSTLFNRLVGKRLALVDDTPGVTRDRREGEAALGDLRFVAVDTAGLEESDPGTLQRRMREQTETALRSADVVLFVVDTRAGLTPLDKHFAGVLRQAGRPVVLVANKAEGRDAEIAVQEFHALGLCDPVPLSAEHGEGMAELYAALMPFFPAPEEDEEGEKDAGGERPDRPLDIAIVGRPNVGKSTLLNRIIGEERMLTGPEAGTTRDSIAVEWTRQGRRFRLHDTAGLRRKARVVEKLEKLSVADTLRAIRFAEVVIIVIDVEQPFERQDLAIAHLVTEEGRAAVIALDKWDLVFDRQQKLAELRAMADRLLPQIRGVPVLPVSGLTGEGIDRLLQAADEAAEVWSRRVPTAALNRWLTDVLEHHPPPAVTGRRIRLRYMTQAKARPPTFVAFCSRPEALPDAYRRYLLNGLRDTFDLPGVPIRLLLRKGENPYEGRKAKE